MYQLTSAFVVRRFHTQREHNVESTLTLRCFSVVCLLGRALNNVAHQSMFELAESEVFDFAKVYLLANSKAVSTNLELIQSLRVTLNIFSLSTDL